MATLIVYPAPGYGGTTCDGKPYREVDSDIGESFATIRAGAGITEGNGTDVLLQTSTTSGFFRLRRTIWTFDTSALTVNAVISSVVLSIFGVGKDAALGESDIYIVASTPASNGTIVAADYSQLGGDSFGSITYTAFSTVAYNDITLNASGIAAISKTGITKLGARIGFDYLNTPPSFLANTRTLLIFNESSGSASPSPKLTITYSLPYGAGGLEGLKGNVTGTGIEDWVRVRTHTVNEDRLTGQMFLDWTNWAVAEIVPKAYHNNDYLTPSVLGVGTSFNLSSLNMRRIEKVVDATNGLIVPASASDFEISLPSVDSNTAYWTQHGEMLSISYGANLTGGSVTVYYHKVPHYMTSRADRLNIHDSYVPMILDKVANQVEDWKRFNNWKPS